MASRLASVMRLAFGMRMRPTSLVHLRPSPTRASFAAVAALAAMVACSSSSQNPPQLGDCTPTATTPCKSSLNGGGGSSAPGDGGQPSGDDGGVIETEGGSCPGAAEIFSAAGSTCATCVETNCCAPASCPNDPACISIAVCVAQTCLANDASCLMTCEGASAPGTTTEFLTFRQCVGASCPGCPAVGSGDL